MLLSLAVPASSIDSYPFAIILQTASDKWDLSASICISSLHTLSTFASGYFSLNLSTADSTISPIGTGTMYISLAFTCLYSSSTLFNMFVLAFSRADIYSFNFTMSGGSFSNKFDILLYITLFERIWFFILCTNIDAPILAVSNFLLMMASSLLSV